MDLPWPQIKGGHLPRHSFKKRVGFWRLGKSGHQLIMWWVMGWWSDFTEFSMTIAHYIDSTGMNWDVMLPFFLMVYRAIPHTITTYSPFYLLHGRGMVLPKGRFKAKISPDIQDVDQVQRLENLKYSLLKAYKEVRLSNRKAHQKNKAYYNKKA